ncbi:uncharacterized protein LOC132547493 [Ylistrum balloti]|uniref:uncharacterized protein LOC132547493 n=1 Tax=Ylistrum balloti TaxID=509963 RepID=UPI002905E16D|nr:uncharacterized protein LOC132547493 [Ylistrum balloti]
MEITQKYNTGCDICWDDVEDADGYGFNLASDDIPFIVLGKEEKPCVHVQDPRKRSRKRKLSSEDDHEYGVSDKTDCLAQVTICKVIKFPQFKNKEKDKNQRTILSEKLQKEFTNKSTIKEYKVYVRMPEEDDHNHPPAPEVATEKPVKIALEELLMSLPKKLLADKIKQEPAEVSKIGIESMEVAEEEEKKVEEFVEPSGIEIEITDNGKDATEYLDFEPTSPRNIAASALASMNTGPTDIISKSPPFPSVSSPSKSQNSTTYAKLVLLESPNQTARYVLLKTPQEEMVQGVSNSPALGRKFKSLQSPGISGTKSQEEKFVHIDQQRKKVPWKGIEGSVAVSDNCFYTDDRSVMEECIKKYEEDTCSIFRCNKTTRIVNLEITEVKCLDNHRLRWVPLCEQWKPADYVADNVPYLVLGRETRMCRFNGNPNINRVKKKKWCVLCNKTPEEQKNCTDVCTCRLRKSEKTLKKQPCPALISIHYIIRFLDFKADTKKKRVGMVKNLRCGLELLEKLKMRIRQEKRIYVTVPSIEVHQNHPIYICPKLKNPCCPCYRTGTCGTCVCKLTGCSRCNNNACRYRNQEGSFKPMRQTRIKKEKRKKKTPYAAKSIRNTRINPDELSPNEQLEREAELETYQENSVVHKVQQEILGMSLEQTRSALLKMLEDDPFHVEAYINPDHAPYHRVQIDTPPIWCSCTQCVEMQNSQMQMCCSQTPCISFHPIFRSVCLRPDHLLMGLLDIGLPSESFAEMGSFSNAQYRRQAYRCFILWQWNNLGKGDIEVPKPPSCVVARIRWRYPSIDNQYSDTFSPDSDFEEANK